MRHAPLFVLVLLLSEALVVRASLALLYYPIRSAIIGFRSLRLLLRVARVMRRFLIARRLLKLLLVNQGHNKVSSLYGIARDSCLHRFVCEINLRKRQKQGSLESAGPERRLAITVKLSSPLSPDICQKRFQSCPYNADDMLEALVKLKSVWKDVKLPQIVES